MAIVNTVHGNQESKWGFSVESTWGTVIADNGTFVTFDGPIPAIDHGLFQDLSVRAGRGRIASSSDAYVSETGGTRILSFSDLIVRKTYLADLLYAVFQNVSEAGTTPYEKTFTWNHATTQADLGGSAGYFATIGIDEPIAARDKKFTSCILKSLTLSANMAEGDGRLMASGEFVSGFASAVGSTFSGTWALPTASYFNFNAPTTLKVENQDAVCYGFDVTFNNNAIRVGHDTSGNAETFALGQPEYEVTGNLSIKYDSNVASVIASFLAGTNTLIQIATGTDGADGNFDMLFSTAKHTGPTKNYGDAEGQKINIPFKAMGVSGDATALATVTLSDGVDRAW